MIKEIENTIYQQIKNQVISCNAAAEEVKFWEKIVRLEEQKLKAEVRLFDYGRSNSDLVIRYENDLYQAKLQLAEAQFNYHISMIELEVRKNSLLSRYLNIWK